MALPQYRMVISVCPSCSSLEARVAVTSGCRWGRCIFRQKSQRGSVEILKLAPCINLTHLWHFIPDKRLRHLIQSVCVCLF